MDPIIILFLFFSLLGVLLAFLFFFKKKGNRLANTLLGIYTFLFAAELLNNSLRWSGEIKTATFVHFNLIHFTGWLIYGPLVFIYVRSVVKERGLKLTDLLFLIPPFLLFVLLFPFYRLPTAKKLAVVQNNTIFEYATFPYGSIWIIILIMLFYAFYTYFTFWKDRRIGVRENVWLKWFVGCYLAYVLLFASYIFLTWFRFMDPKYDYFVDVVIVLFIGLLAFFGFVQPEVFEGKTLKDVIPFVKYRKTGLSKALSKEMKEKLLAIMVEEKPYLNNELRLNDLSESLNLSRNHTSQIINEHFNCSFFDFINQYRVAEAKTLLLDSAENGSTITQIAYDVGFNNRASFYKAFKKFTDRSPSDHIKQIKAS